MQRLFERFWCVLCSLGHAELCTTAGNACAAIGSRPSYGPQTRVGLSKWCMSWTVMIVQLQQLFMLKVSERNHLIFFDLDMVSYRTLAQQTAKSKSEVTQCRNTLLKILITDTNYLYYRRHLSKRLWEAALLAIATDR